MAFCYATDVRQTDPPAFFVSFFRSLCSNEYVEYGLHLIRGNGFSFIMHGQHCAPAYQCNIDSYRGIRRTVFHGIADHIFHCAPDCRPIPPDLGRIAHELEAGPMFGRKLIAHLLNDLLQVEFLQVKA